MSNFLFIDHLGISRPARRSAGKQPLGRLHGASSLERRRLRARCTGVPCSLGAPPALGPHRGLSAKPMPLPIIPQAKMGVTAVLVLPLLLLGISGLLFIYQEVSRLWSKSAVQNKVVVITDAISGLGKGKRVWPPTGAHAHPAG